MQQLGDLLDESVAAMPYTIKNQDQSVVTENGTTPSVETADDNNSTRENWESRYVGLQKVLAKRDDNLRTTTELDALPRRPPFRSRCPARAWQRPLSPRWRLRRLLSRLRGERRTRRGDRSAGSSASTRSRRRPRRLRAGARRISGQKLCGSASRSTKRGR
jgi:hypothetical protein